MKLIAIAFVVVFSAQNSFAAVTTVTVAGSDKRIVALREVKTLLLHADDIGKAFDWEVKVVSDGKLITFCRERAGGVCIPLQLNKIMTRKTKRGLFIDAEVLARTLRFEIELKGERITLRKRSAPNSEVSAAPAYNAAWGKGRGFRPGQTLPDIPLYDMAGKEVRFSQYLGKQYVIYCWASW